MRILLQFKSRFKLKNVLLFSKYLLIKNDKHLNQNPKFFIFKALCHHSIQLRLAEVY